MFAIQWDGNLNRVSSVYFCNANTKGVRLYYSAA